MTMGGQPCPLAAAFGYAPLIVSAIGGAICRCGPGPTRTGIWSLAGNCSIRLSYGTEKNKVPTTARDGLSLGINRGRLAPQKPPMESDIRPSAKDKSIQAFMTQQLNQEVFTTPHGNAVLQWPAKMSQAEFEDFELWLDLMKRKLKRVISEPKPVNFGDSSFYKNEGNG